MRAILAILIIVTLARAVQAQTQDQSQTRPAGVPTRGPVATQPSSSPFSNPIGQGVPPAASSSSNWNTRQTNVPLPTQSK